MLKFTYLFNFGLVGALVVPAAVQRGTSLDQLNGALESTNSSLEALSEIEAALAKGEYVGVEAILGATESPFGGERERSALLDQLRREIGALEGQVEGFDLPKVLEHLQDDPTKGQDASLSTGSGPQVATTGLTADDREQVGNIWPPIVSAAGANQPRKAGNKLTVEKPGFTADALRQGRAYYRAERYKEALVLFTTREGEPEADYWMGRCFERLDKTKDAITAYTRVIDNENSGALAERAESDRSFLRWKTDFDRRVKDHESSAGDQL